MAKVVLGEREPLGGNGNGGRQRMEERGHLRPSKATSGSGIIETMVKQL